MGKGTRTARPWYLPQNPLVSSISRIPSWERSWRSSKLPEKAQHQALLGNLTRSTRSALHSCTDYSSSSKLYGWHNTDIYIEHLYWLFSAESGAPKVPGCIEDIGVVREARDRKGDLAVLWHYSTSPMIMNRSHTGWWKHHLMVHGTVFQARSGTSFWTSTTVSVWESPLVYLDALFQWRSMATKMQVTSTEV